MKTVTITLKNIKTIVQCRISFCSFMSVGIFLCTVIIIISCCYLNNDKIRHIDVAHADNTVDIHFIYV